MFFFPKFITFIKFVLPSRSFELDFFSFINYLLCAPLLALSKMYRVYYVNYCYDVAQGRFFLRN